MKNDTNKIKEVIKALEVSIVVVCVGYNTKTKAILSES